jgi:hypothetical protein
MSRTRVAIFLVVLSLFLYVVNWPIYTAVVDFFPVVSATHRAALGGLLGSLSASFVLSTLIGMRYYNWLTRIYYIVAATWMGFVVYMFFASMIYELLLLVHMPWSSETGRGLMGASVVAGAYGLVHARRLHVKHVAVTLPKMVPSWRGKRIIFASDFHLGQLSGSSWARYVVAIINSLPHEAVFIGGDLFDGTGAPDINELIAPLKDLKAAQGVFFVTGNHEEFGDNSKFIAAARACGMRVLMNEVAVLDGLQIIGVDWAEAANKKNFRNILASLAIDRDRPSILLKHEPKDLDVASELGISLQISGHTHRAQQWPLEYVARRVYNGYAYGLKNYRDMLVYISSGAGTWGPPMRIGTDCEVVVFTLV